MYKRQAFGLGTGIGFILASYLISIGYDRLNSDKIPPAFRGFPITLIYVCLLYTSILDMEEYEKMQATIRLMSALSKGEQSAKESGWMELDEVEKLLGVSHDAS